MKNMLGHSSAVPRAPFYSQPCCWQGMEGLGENAQPPTNVHLVFQDGGGLNFERFKGFVSNQGALNQFQEGTHQHTPSPNSHQEEDGLVLSVQRPRPNGSLPGLRAALGGRGLP